MTALAKIDFCPCLGDQPVALWRFVRRVAWKMPPGTFVDGHLLNGTLFVGVRITGRDKRLCVGPGETPSSTARRLRDLIAAEA